MFWLLWCSLMLLMRLMKQSQEDHRGKTIQNSFNKSDTVNVSTTICGTPKQVWDCVECSSMFLRCLNMFVYYLLYRFSWDVKVWPSAFGCIICKGGAKRHEVGSIGYPAFWLEMIGYDQEFYRLETGQTVGGVAA